MNRIFPARNPYSGPVFYALPIYIRPQTRYPADTIPFGFYRNMAFFAWGDIHDALNTGFI